MVDRRRQIKRAGAGDFQFPLKRRRGEAKTGRGLARTMKGSLLKLCVPAGSRRSLARFRRKRAVRLQPQGRPLRAFQRPFIFVAPFVPALHEQPDGRLVHHAGVVAFEPVVVPAQNDVLVVVPRPPSARSYSSVSKIIIFLGVVRPCQAWNAPGRWMSQALQRAISSAGTLMRSNMV